jgi:hypothetical protein
MPADAALLLAGLILLAAFLYASVGHAGASGYLAAMALFSVAPAVMKPTALVLNILVSAIATWKFCRAGYFSRATFVPLALASVPMAFIGGYITLPAGVYKPILGVALLLAATRFWIGADRETEVHSAPPAKRVLAGTGGAIGLLSGLTGVGGGIFLSPLLILLKWSPVQQASGIAAAFILVNSVAGLAGQLAHTVSLPEWIPLWATAAIAGGYSGAEFGSRRFNVPVLRRMLSLVLTIAGGKMLFGV